MKEIFEISVQLPFSDYAIVEWEMTEDEYDAFLEYCGDQGIWHEGQYHDLLSAAAIAAANYIVGSYCERDDAEAVIYDWSCTPEKLMKYLNESEESIADFVNGDGQHRREVIVNLLYENQAFYLDEA